MATIERTHDGITFFRRIAGTGGNRPVVVLVHGLVISSRYMEPLMRSLAPWCDVYAPDLPGFGHSRRHGAPLSLTELADALDAFMGRHGLDRAVIAGNSFGAQIATELALLHPQRVRALVLLAPTVDAGRRQLFRQVARWALDGFQESPLLVATLARDFLLAGLRTAVSTLRTMMRDALEYRIMRVKQPVLVVRGVRDPLVSRRWTHDLASSCPGETAEILGGTHALHYSRPDETARAIRLFVARATP